MRVETTMQDIPVDVVNYWGRVGWGGGRVARYFMALNEEDSKKTNTVRKQNW